MFWYNFKVFSMIYVWLSQILQNVNGQVKNKKNVFSSLSFEAKEIIISYCLRLLAQSKYKNLSILSVSNLRRKEN